MFPVIYKAFVKLKNYFWSIFSKPITQMTSVKKPIPKAFYQKNHFNLYEEIYSCF